jgi:peptidoglycan-associated lipoprotein
MNLGISPRKLAGVAILALVVGGTAVEAILNRHVLAARYVVPFARSDRPAEGADAIEAQAASFLKAYPKYRVQVTGYVEPGGDARAAVELSERRAQVVRDALEADGVDPARIVAVGGGGSDLLKREEGETEASYGRRLARAEIKIVRD